MAGPAIGGLLSVISLRAPFFVYSILLFCSGLVALFFLKGDSIGRKVSSSDTSKPKPATPTKIPGIKPSSEIKPDTRRSTTTTF